MMRRVYRYPWRVFHPEPFPRCGLSSSMTVPRGVPLSITIQCLFMYLIEYFAANYFMNSAYSPAGAKGSAAPELRGGALELRREPRPRWPLCCRR
jgi:hypothetical protein